jgi:hypothetical protein
MAHGISNPYATKQALHLVESEFGSRQGPRLRKADPSAAQEKPMAMIPRNGSVTHTAIPKPNFVEGRGIPGYAAVRFTDCASQEEAGRLLGQVQALKRISLCVVHHCPSTC